MITLNALVSLQPYTHLSNYSTDLDIGLDYLGRRSFYDPDGVSGGRDVYNRYMCRYTLNDPPSTDSCNCLDLVSWLIYSTKRKQELTLAY